MRVALYVRPSASDESCELQLCELRQFVKRSGWTLYEEYVEPSDSLKKASGPAMRKLMADAAQRCFDVVMVRTLYCFARSLDRLKDQLATLESYGIRFMIPTQGLDTDPSNPTSRLFLNCVAAAAEIHRPAICERKSVRIRAGVRAARKNGKTLGRPRRKVSRDEIVRLRRDERLSWRAISRRLQAPVSTCVDAYNRATL